LIDLPQGILMIDLHSSGPRPTQEKFPSC
jgi:hypothetical protein